MMSGVTTGAFFALQPLRAGRPANGRAAAPGAPDDAASGAPSSDASSSSGEQQRIQELKQADTSVRQHEAAHQAAGGAHAGGASFTYTRGPDGKNYAVAGEVPIDVSAEGEPGATIRKMDTVKAAALAPADPSPQDLRVAQQAEAQKAQAQQEQRRKQAEEGTGAVSASGGGSAAPALAMRGAAAYGAAFGLGTRTASRGIVV